ncbi:MAG: hypothetical protein K2G03_00355 [Bacilli bacterium]|nr:hypothetical protein [Bacilli bacterium]MDE6141029.1 hypothetical protein [Bacilli bacterium]
MEFNVDNNGIRLGTVNANTSNMKKFMVIAAIGFAVFTTIGCHSEKKEDKQEIVVSQNYTYSYEPRYSGIEYEVQWGDTLTEIVAAYESDYNKILRYVDDIERENKIDGILRQGITIRLCGVPESKLANYGYTSDYSIVGYDVMVRDAYDWLIEERQWIVESERNVELVDKFNIDFTEFVIRYNAYLQESDVNEKAKKLDDLVVLLNDVLEQFKIITGLNFEQHHRAYPIPQEQPSYENIL